MQVDNRAFFSFQFHMEPHIFSKGQEMLDNNTSISSSRIAYIDFLKFVGLTGIIIAHVGSPDWMMMARSFDVPLMVILSSILGVNSYKKYCENSKQRPISNVDIIVWIED